VSSFAKVSAAAEALHFIIGRDRADQWVVVETHGLAGGLFTDEATALRFARDESRGRQGAIEIADYRLDFSIRGH
jgi:hypothetical protein